MAQRRKASASGRLQKLLIDVKVAEPYEVADGITIRPLSKKRSQAMADAQSAVGLTNALLQQALGRAASPRPKYPTPPEPPEAPKKPSAEASKAYEDLRVTYDSAVETWRGLVEQWEHQRAEWEAELDRHDDAMNGLAERLRSQGDEYTKAMFGPEYQAVIDYFDDEPVEHWNAFVEDFKIEMGITARPEQVPDDGTCPHCGRVEDEEQAGKELELSI